MHRFIYITFLGLILSIIAYIARPSTTSYLRKAKNALNKEDQISASINFQKAYKTSLDKSFFLADRDILFSHLLMSYNKKVLAAITAKSSSLYFFHLLENEKNILPLEIGKVKHINISPSGNYILLTSQHKDKPFCSLFIAHLFTQEKFLHENIIDCDTIPAISNAGDIVFTQNNQISILKDLQDIEQKKQISSHKLQKVYKHIPAKFHFTYTFKNQLFLLYGNAGHYLLYHFNNNGTYNLMSKSVATPKIFFIGKSDTPHVITGGASQYNLIFFASQYGKEYKKVAKLPSMHNITFMNKQIYYFILRKRIFKFDKANKSNPVSLPFLAKELFVGVDQTLYFLSAMGSIMRYQGKMPNSLSMHIFKQVLNFEASQ